MLWVVELLGGLRWYLLLRVQGFRLSWRRATSIFLIGLFFLTFTPGLIGGDAARALYVIRETPERKAEAVLVVAMEPADGADLADPAGGAGGAVPLSMAGEDACDERAGICDAADPGRGDGGADSLGACGAAAVALDAGAAPATGEKLREIAQTFRAYRRHWPRMIQALVNTVVAHMFYFLTFYCAARALGAFDSAGARPWRGLWDVFQHHADREYADGLPISFAGIGIRESLFQVLLKDLCNIAPGVGAAIGRWDLQCERYGECRAGYCCCGTGRPGRGGGARLGPVKIQECYFTKSLPPGAEAGFSAGGKRVVSPRNGRPIWGHRLGRCVVFAANRELHRQWADFQKLADGEIQRNVPLALVPIVSALSVQAERRFGFRSVGDEWLGETCC